MKKLNTDSKLTILIALWILDQLIMLGMFLFFARWNIYMNKQEKLKAELKVVRVLKYWEDADIFRLETKKKIAEMTIAELQEFFGMERGL